MVAFSGPDPIAVLIGAKRSSATLIQKIAVHPDHLRQGHARHLLTSLASKLTILGPPRIVAEVPEALAPACELFKACGYVLEAVLTDYELDQDPQVGGEATTSAGGFVIPITVDDLAANGLLGEAQPPTCWERSVETLTARKGEVVGVAVATDERIEAYILDLRGEAPAGAAEVVSLRSFVDDGGARVRQLLAHLSARGMSTLSLPKVHPAEISGEWLHALGFRAAGRHRLYAATARPG